MDNKEEQQEAQKNPETEAEQHQEGGDETPENEGLTPEQIEDLRKRANASSQNYERAKKAEEELKKYKQSTQPKEETPKGEVLSSMDALLLAKASIELEDVDTVTRYAKFNNISVADALKDKTLKTIIAERVEERETARATQTRGARTAPKVSNDALIEQASSGRLPDSDDGIDKLTSARMENRKKK